MEYAAVSDKGIIREQNEDFWNIVLDKDENPVAFIVADGMGGHHAGDVASRLAVETISEVLCQYVETDHLSGCVENVLEKAVHQANQAVFQYAHENLNGNSTGTTLTAGVLCEGVLTLAHIGDSRFYVLRNGVLEKITRDHSFVGELVEKGILDHEEARTHPLRNQITRALGYEKQIDIDIHRLKIENKDTYLFCTDGLYMKITTDELLSMLNRQGNITKMLNEMVELANQRGGDDNITAIIVRV